MYSILIQNEKTMESFHHFHPLFLNAISEGRIGVCQWLESGETVETALPEIYDLIADKDEWKAIVVQINDEGDPDHPTASENPYDFLENKDALNTLQESNIPLIRLTQILGGVPAPQMEFECEPIYEEYKAPRIIYRPKENLEAKAEYERLSKKYNFNGRRPSEIVLVSLRTKEDLQIETVQKVWRQNIETESSEFWRRNKYPSCCRFTFYEIENQGPNQKTADMFKLWSAVLLLGTNDVDASALQAYKLHRLDVEIDRDTFQDNMQATVGRAIGASRYIKRSIQREIEQKISQESVLPDYKLQAPVVLKIPPNSELFANEQAFGLTSDSALSDMDRWTEMRDSAEKSLADATICAERALDHTANKMRSYCKYRADEIFPLDDYQKEDFDKELWFLRNKIFETRAELPGRKKANQNEFAARARSVRRKLLKRVTTRQAVIGYAIIAFVFAASCIPAAVFHVKHQWGSAGLLAGIILLGIILFAVLEFFALFLQKCELRTDVRYFNSFINSYITRIAENNSTFSKYMGNIASYMHGSSYLSLLEKKTFLQDESTFYKQNHLAALNALLMELKSWGAAFHLPIELVIVESDETLAFDTDVPPGINPMYTFYDTDSYNVEVNHSGDYIDSPFAFIKRLHIIREELYDDAR